MNDTSRVLLATVLGAAAGGLVGYLYLTEDGRRLRSRLEPGLEDVSRELRRLRSSVEKARLAAAEGWGTIEDLAKPARRPPDDRSGAFRAPARY